MNPQSRQQLAALREAMQRRAAEAAEARAAAARAAERERAEREAFARAVGPVQALADRGLALQRHRLRTGARHFGQADEREALREALSDEVDVESLLLTDDGLSWRRPGIAPDVVTRLRRGQWSIQGQIDLHGHTREQAREALADFVRRSHRQGRRCLRVVHGKGHGSPGRRPVLKSKVQRWLAQCNEVVAFTQASGHEGGAGALIVLLDSRG